MNNKETSIKEYISTLKRSKLIPKEKHSFFGSRYYPILDDLDERYPKVSRETKKELLFSEYVARMGNFWAYWKVTRLVKRAGKLTLYGYSCFRNNCENEFSNAMEGITDDNYEQYFPKAFSFLNVEGINLIYLMRILNRKFPIHVICYCIDKEQGKIKDEKDYMIAQLSLNIVTTWIDVVVNKRKPYSSFEQINREIRNKKRANERLYMHKNILRYKSTEMKRIFSNLEGDSLPHLGLAKYSGIVTAFSAEKHWDKETGEINREEYERDDNRLLKEIERNSKINHIKVEGFFKEKGRKKELKSDERSYFIYPKDIKPKDRDTYNLLQYLRDLIDFWEFLCDLRDTYDQYSVLFTHGLWTYQITEKTKGPANKLRSLRREIRKKGVIVDTKIFDPFILFGKSIWGTITEKITKNSETYEVLNNLIEQNRKANGIACFESSKEDCFTSEDIKLMERTKFFTYASVKI